jgi:hypothetical protein
MAAVTPFWTSRRVFVSGCATSLGTAVAAELVARGADVTGLVESTPSAGSSFLESRIYERVTIVRGGAADYPAIASLLASSEAEVVVIPGDQSVRAVHAQMNAARAAVPDAAVIVAIPHASNRAVAVAEAFRVADANPVGVACVPPTAPCGPAAEFLISHAERVTRRDPAALRGVAAFAAPGRLAA